jgi:hypothetical protein
MQKHIRRYRLNVIAWDFCIPLCDFTPFYFFMAWILIKYGNDVIVTFLFKTS